MRMPYSRVQEHLAARRLDETARAEALRLYEGEAAGNALRDVVWQGGDDGAGHACHGDRVPSIPRMQFGRVTYRSGESATHASWHGVAYGVPRSRRTSAVDGYRVA
jgi:hypothetical protein